MRLRGQALTLTTVPHVAPRDEAVGSATALPEGVADFNALRARELADRLTSGRDVAPGEIRRLFSYRQHEARVTTMGFEIEDSSPEVFAAAYKPELPV